MTEDSNTGARAIVGRVRPLGWIGVALLPFLLWSFLSERALIDARFNTLSAVAEARLELRVRAATREGKPCVAIATASDGPGTKALVEARLAGWVETCQRMTESTAPPVIVRLSEKNRVWIDNDAAAEVPYERSKRARELADALIGWQYYEAASWSALNGLYDEDRAIPWWMAAPGRPVRTALRASEAVILFSLQILGLISLLMSLFNLRGGTGATSYRSAVLSPSAPSGGGARGVLDDEE